MQDSKTFISNTFLYYIKRVGARAQRRPAYTPSHKSFLIYSFLQTVSEPYKSCACVWWEWLLFLKSDAGAEWTNGNLKRPQCITKSCAWRAHKSDDDDDSIKSMFSPSVLHAMPGRNTVAFFYDGVAAARLNISFFFYDSGRNLRRNSPVNWPFRESPPCPWHFVRLLFISVAPIDIATFFFSVLLCACLTRRRLVIKKDSPVIALLTGETLEVVDVCARPHHHLEGGDHFGACGAIAGASE